MHIIIERIIERAAVVATSRLGAFVNIAAIMPEAGARSQAGVRILGRAR
ncbi:hypothetical protein [Brachybacterium subflavum]|nr:hypothetical protein [Brachybacterium subflavum]